VIAEACRKLADLYARLWRPDETGTVLRGLAQVNNDGLMPFTEISFAVQVAGCESGANVRNRRFSIP
jgi:hypothetical protein